MKTFLVRVRDHDREFSPVIWRGVVKAETADAASHDVLNAVCADREARGLPVAFVESNAMALPLFDELAS